MPSDITILLFIFLGLISGLLGGMIGIGGGVVTVPALYYIFNYMGIIETQVMQVAVSTSLASGLVTSGISTLLQLKKKAITFKVIRLIIPGLALGCIIGALVTHYLPSAYIRIIFGIMALLLGTYFSFPKLPNLYISAEPNKSLSLFGFAIGWLSSMLGIGGGSLTFPVLLGYHVPVKNSSATSSSSTFISTLIGTCTYLILGHNKTGLPLTFGYIEMPAFIAISIGSFFSTPFGVKLSSTLDIAIIKRVFGVCLFLTGLTMLFF